MAIPVPGEFKVVTVVRSAGLASIPLPASSSPSPFDNRVRTTPLPLQATGASDETIYGVPVSAVQHCCGRGCKHCRIYWHRTKP